MKYLIPLLFPLTLFAETQTTSNLIINGNFESGNSNGWTTSGSVQVINDCCTLNNVPSNYDIEFGDTGSIEQSFDLTSDLITQPMLNNGITLNSIVEVQNGECSLSGCWAGANRGGYDSFTIRLQVRDSDNNVLATTSQTRTEPTGIAGEYFNDSISFTGIGSNIGNLRISGIDGNAPSTLGGVNLDNISAFLIYDDEVLSQTQTTEINTTVETIEETLEFTENKIPEIQELFVEEINLELLAKPEIIEIQQELFIEEIATKEINTGIINIFKEPEIIENFEQEEMPMENIYNEEIKTTEIEQQPIQEKTGNENEQISETSETRLAEEPRHESSGEQKQTVNEPTEERVAVSESEGRTEETDTVAESSAQEQNEDDTVVEENERTSNTDDEAVADNGNTDQAESEELVSVEDMIKEVNATITRIDLRLIATQQILAKAMVSNLNIDSYYKSDNNVFNKRRFDGGEFYETRKYIDERNLVAQNEGTYFDPLNEHQEKLQEINDKIRILEGN